FFSVTKSAIQSEGFRIISDSAIRTDQSGESSPLFLLLPQERNRVMASRQQMSDWTFFMKMVKFCRAQPCFCFTCLSLYSVGVIPKRCLKMREKYRGSLQPTM